MNQYFRIGLRPELTAPLGQPFAQRGRVLDDAVMYDGELLVCIGVGMGIDRVGYTVCCPPGVPHREMPG